MERLEQFNKIMGYDMYARKANVDVTGIDRYKVIEVKDNLNTCYKYLTKKETQKIINYVVDHLKMIRMKMFLSWLSEQLIMS